MGIIHAWAVHMSLCEKKTHVCGLRSVIVIVTAQTQKRPAHHDVVVVKIKLSLLWYVGVVGNGACYSTMNRKKATQYATGSMHNDDDAFTGKRTSQPSSIKNVDVFHPDRHLKRLANVSTSTPFNWLSVRTRKNHRLTSFLRTPDEQCKSVRTEAIMQRKYPVRRKP